jgi:hypothetical protein
MRRGSLVSTIASTKSSLTPSVVAKKDGHQRKSTYELKSSSLSSSYSYVDSHKKVNYSDIIDSDYSSSQSRSISRQSRGTKSRSVSLQLISKLASLEKNNHISTANTPAKDWGICWGNYATEEGTTLMQLHTDIATKDLGLLKLNQKIICQVGLITRD